MEQEIKDFDKEIRESRKVAALPTSLKDKLEAQNNMKALEATRNNKRRELFDSQDRIDEQRNVLIGKIEKQLKQRQSLEPLFILRWIVAQEKFLSLLNDILVWPIQTTHSMAAKTGESMSAYGKSGGAWMWLRELQIRNFRKVDDLTVTFPRGLTVLVGENNSGKTAIIDALRLMLFSSRDFDSLRLTEDDFRNGTDYAPIEISCTFTGLKDEDEVHFQECLVDIGDGNFELQVNARVEFNKTTSRCNVKMWGGETEGGSLPSNHYNRLSTIYLQPLRDPERGLRTCVKSIATQG